MQLNMVGRSTLSDEYFINYESAMSAAQIRHCLCWVRQMVVNAVVNVLCKTPMPLCTHNHTHLRQVKAKYGEQGMRVFKVLADAEEVQMEQRTVADKALIVEKVLYH